MIAVDTNVVVRLLVADDVAQTAVARSLLASNQLWVAKTVLLETHWVLTRVYGFEQAAIKDAFAVLLGLPNVQTEDKFAVLAAFNLMERGADFADAIHLSSRPAGSEFASFDRSLVQCANRAGTKFVSLLGGRRQRANS